MTGMVGWAAADADNGAEVASVLQLRLGIVRTGGAV